MRELRSHQLYPPKACVALLTVLVVIISGVKTIAARTSQQESETVPPGQEKKLGIAVPRHLPLKVRVDNLNSRNWAHDLEVEVTNTSERPIYFLSFYIILPEVSGPAGHKLGFWLHYGRAELLEFETPVGPDDVPLQPDETHTFKISQGSANGWDYLKEKEGRPEPKMIKLFFQELNFGDGTGYLDSGGTPVNIHKKSH